MITKLIAALEGTKPTICLNDDGQYELHYDQNRYDALDEVINNELEDLAKETIDFWLRECYNIYILKQ